MIQATPLSHGQHVRALETDAFRLLETRHPRGLVVDRHQHERACVNFVLQGLYREDIGRERGAFEPLTSVFKPAGEPHANCFSESPARCLLIELVDPGLVTELDVARVASTRDPAAARSALALWRELAAPDACTSLAVEQLALELYGLVLGTSAPRSAGSARVREATDTLHADPRERWTLSSLAAHVGLHPSHLARAFRTAHGCTAGEYLRRLRVNELARALALGAEPIGLLALELGFADQSHGTRAFQRWLGTSPGAYRSGFRPD